MSRRHLSRRGHIRPLRDVLFSIRLDLCAFSTAALSRSDASV